MVHFFIPEVSAVTAGSIVNVTSLWAHLSLLYIGHGKGGSLTARASHIELKKKSSPPPAFPLPPCLVAASHPPRPASTW